ncbi:MAG: MBL fold metallo-hydrolase [Deltaproteobacteria bacterium]|nr:MBL fold metallo-hydrolase [Deltaproteobacteria bacterium]MBW2085050.1 MBL fold metallo-hydrolase [Deltaproteobacteria bacterium]
MLVKFWGVRGSIPAPIRTEQVSAKIIKALSLAKNVDLEDEEAISSFVQGLPFEIKGTYGGNTACVEVRSGETIIILDAGSGVRDLGLSLMKDKFDEGEGTAHFLISHTHWDHIQGFPYFVPALVSGNRILIYSPKEDLAQRFIAQQMDQDMFPIRLETMGAEIEFVRLAEQNVDIGGLSVSHMLMRHPGGSYAYRLEENGRALIYATDAEYPKLNQTAIQPYLDFFTGADTLIFDAMYTFSEAVAKIGWGHGAVYVGVDLAVKAGVKRLVLFHHEPTYDDDKFKEILEKTKTYYNLVRENTDLEIIIAMEGLELEI